MTHDPLPGSAALCGCGHPWYEHVAGRCDGPVQRSPVFPDGNCPCTNTPPTSAAFDLALIQSHLDEHAARDQRRREERLRLLAEYEAEHGEISEAEIAALWEDR